MLKPMTNNFFLITDFRSNFGEYLYILIVLFLFYVVSSYLFFSNTLFPDHHFTSSSDLFLQKNLLYLSLYFRIIGFSLMLFLVSSFLAILQNITEMVTNFNIDPNFIDLYKILLIILSCIVFVVGLIIIGFREKIHITSTQLIHIRYYSSFSLQSTAYPIDNFTLMYREQYLMLTSIPSSFSLQENSFSKEKYRPVFKLDRFSNPDKVKMRNMVTPLENLHIKVADNVKNYLQPD